VYWSFLAITCTDTKKQKPNVQKKLNIVTLTTINRHKKTQESHEPIVSTAVSKMKVIRVSSHGGRFTNFER